MPPLLLSLLPFALEEMVEEIVDGVTWSVVVDVVASTTNWVEEMATNNKIIKSTIGIMINRVTKYAVKIN